MWKRAREPKSSSTWRCNPIAKAARSTGTRRTGRFPPNPSRLDRQYRLVFTARRLDSSRIKLRWLGRITRVRGYISTLPVSTVLSPVSSHLTFLSVMVVAIRALLRDRLCDTSQLAISDPSLVQCYRRFPVPSAGGVLGGSSYHHLRN